MIRVPKKNKFDSLDKAELLRVVLEQENELEQLRPKPPKFRLGQLVAQQGKNPMGWQGQPCQFFIILSVQQRLGQWHYGYAKAPGLNNFHVYREDKLRAITQQELTGVDSSQNPQAPQATSVVANAAVTTAAPQANPDLGGATMLQYAAEIMQATDLATSTNPQAIPMPHVDWDEEA